MTNQTSSAAKQAGLSENAAGALAYFLVVPAIVFLLVAPYNRSSYVRFHSWQCIFLAAGWMVVDAAVFAMARLFPTMAAIEYGLSSMIALVMLIVWVAILMKAINGERYKLPIVGDLADRQANR